MSWSFIGVTIVAAMAQFFCYREAYLYGAADIKPLGWWVCGVCFAQCAWAAWTALAAHVSIEWVTQ